MSKKWLCFQFNNPKQIKYISALMRGELWVRVKFIFISFKPSPNSELHANVALSTTRSSIKSTFGYRAKRSFYKWQYNWLYHSIRNSNVGGNLRVACFNGLKGVNSLVVAASRELNIPVLFFENAPFPSKVQIDWKGVNYASSIPRNSEFYTRLGDDRLVADWRKSPPNARQSIKKSSVGQVKDIEGLLESQKYIFCPLQVPDDSQLTVYGGWIKDIFHFLECINLLTPELPDGVNFRIKEHPSSRVSLTQEILDFENSKIVLDNETDTMDIVENSIAVLTINSTVGLEAFHFNKPVITLGKAFYSFSNLTSRAESFTELKSLIGGIGNLGHSEKERNLFMSFLHYWYPTVDDILEGRFTLQELEARFIWLQSQIEHNVHSNGLYITD